MTGDDTSLSCSPGQSSAGIVGPGSCSGDGSPRTLDDPDSAPRCAASSPPCRGITACGAPSASAANSSSSESPSAIESIRRYRWRGPERSPSQIWRTFLANHRPQIWAADLLTIQTLTFRTLYVFFFITHDRRELLHVNVTANPTAAWEWRQLLETTAWGRKPRLLIRDRDSVYGGDFIDRAKGLGVATLLSPIRAPRANAIAERVVRTLRADCLDHLIVLNERHLIALLREYVSYYNTERPHRSLFLQPPTPIPRPQSGPVSSYSVLGGLHHFYQRAA